MPLLHDSWHNHAKLIKATAPNLALIKGAHSYGSFDLWLCDILDKWRASVTNFTKALRHQNSKTKNRIKSICSLGSKIRWSILNASWNKVKLVCQKGVFFWGIGDHIEAKQFSRSSLTAFMVISFIQYPSMITPEKANLNKIRLKILINFKSKFEYILFYSLKAIFFHFYKKTTTQVQVQHRLIKA